MVQPFYRPALHGGQQLSSVSHIRVFSDSTGAFKPEILSDALHLDLPGLDMDKVAAYIESNQTEDLYRYLLLTQCNALNDASSPYV